MELTELLALDLSPPGLPKAAALLLKELARPHPNMRRINQLFASDPALASRLLELANSQAYQCPRQVVGISEALALVGLAQLRTVVAASSLYTASKAVPGLHMPQFWRYSLQTAKLARSLAGIVRQNQVAAYTAGLLHCLGELPILMADPDKVRMVNDLVSPLDLRRGAMERRIFGYTYAHVTAGMAKRWQLPSVVVNAIRHQLAPFEKQAYEPLAGIVHLAVWRTRVREAGFTEREMAVTFPDKVGLVLGLDIDMVLQQDPIDWTVRPDMEDDLV